MRLEKDQRVCPGCSGEGQVICEQNVPPYEYAVTCERCGGDGWIWDELELRLIMNIALRIDLPSGEYTEWRGEFADDAAGKLKAIHAVGDFLRLRLLNEAPARVQQLRRLVRKAERVDARAWIRTK